MTLLKTMKSNEQPQQQTYKSQPPLVLAVLAGSIGDVEDILDKDPEAAASTLDVEKRSPLHAAAFAGYAEIAELLITKGSGARVDAKDNQWLTPLHRACRTGSEEVVSVLLKYNADEKARDKLWRTPGHIAAANNAVKRFTSDPHSNTFCSWNAKSDTG